MLSAKLKKATLTLYQLIWWWNLLFTAFACFFILKYPFNGTVVLYCIIIKAMSYTSTIVYRQLFLPNENYFFRNTGYPLRKLYMLCFLIDLVPFSIITTICYHIKN